MRRTIRSLVTVVTLSAVLTACTGDTDEPEADPTTEQSAETGSSQDGEADSVTFGDAAEYDNGVAVTVGEPESFTPSANAQTGVEPEFVRFEVTMVNGSDRAVSPRRLSLTVESAGQQAAAVIDRGNDITPAPRQRLQPGEELSWDVAFGVVDPADVTVEAQLGPDTDPIVVTGSE